MVVRYGVAVGRAVEGWQFGSTFHIIASVCPPGTNVCGYASTWLAIWAAVSVCLMAAGPVTTK
jgi:hypothetical protein